VRPVNVKKAVNGFFTKPLYPLVTGKFGGIDMSYFLAALLLAPAALPEIDRRALDLQARAEALRPRTIQASARSGALDLEATTTICRAASGQRDPAAFLGTLSRAYGLDAQASAALRGSCAAYLAGRADARR
jgi:hypothetical protein